MTGGTTLRTIVNDISKDLKQTFDDKEVLDIQIAHWVIMIGNRIRSQHIAKRDSGAFLSVFPNVPVQMFTSNAGRNQIKGRKYIEIPEVIYDYDKDGGIEYISYYLEDIEPGCPPPFTNQTFTRTTPSDVQRIYFSSYEKPTPKNPYFYRVGRYIYFLGVECANVKNVEIGIYAALKPVTDPELQLDEPFDFPEETLYILKRQVIDLGRFVLLMPQDKVNDGTNEQVNVPANKLTSVNELVEDTPINK
jgi:hypothetical protein